MTSLPTGQPDFSEFEREVRWVGGVCGDNSLWTCDSDDDCTMGLTCGPLNKGGLKYAPLRCTPYYRDWGGIGTLHVYGDMIVPDAVYEVQMVHQDCDEFKAFENNYSTKLDVLTVAKWGDADDNQQGSQPNFNDIVAIVDRFRDIASAPIIPRADLGRSSNAAIPNQIVNFIDITLCVDAFRGLPYPHDPDEIATCP
jgi:hypothetical protein